MLLTASGAVPNDDWSYLWRFMHSSDEYRPFGENRNVDDTANSIDPSVKHKRRFRTSLAPLHPFRHTSSLYFCCGGTSMADRIKLKSTLFGGCIHPVPSGRAIRSEEANNTAAGSDFAFHPGLP